MRRGRFSVQELAEVDVALVILMLNLPRISRIFDLIDIIISPLGHHVRTSI